MKMRIKLWLLIAVGIVIANESRLQAQQTYVLIPEADAVTTFQFPNQNWGSHLQLSAYAWTQGGNFSLHRSYIRYNLTQADWSRPLLKATLHLYHFDPGPWSNQGMNSFRIGLADTLWDENTINWHNQPGMDSLHFVDVGQTAGPVDISVDVTDMIKYAYENGNNGFVIRLLEEQIYRMVLFGSRENEGYIPLLELEFVDYRSICRDFFGPASLNIVNISSAHGQAARVNPEILHIGQTQSTPLVVERVFMRPDFSLLPPSYNIDYANLKLIKPDSAGLENTGFNDLVIMPINQGFDTQTLNWNNQPAFNNSVSSSSAMSRGTWGTVNINMIDLMTYSRDMGNFNGYLIKTRAEFLQGRAYFGGSGNPGIGYQPKLTICYTANVSVKELDRSLDFQLFPNPASEQVNVNIFEPSAAELQLLVRDMYGRLILPPYQVNIEPGRTNIEIDTQMLPAGLYMIECRSQHKFGIKKLVISH